MKYGPSTWRKRETVTKMQHPGIEEMPEWWAPHINEEGQAELFNFSELDDEDLKSLQEVCDVPSISESCVSCMAAVELGRRAAAYSEADVIERSSEEALFDSPVEAEQPVLTGFPEVERSNFNVKGNVLEKMDELNSAIAMLFNTGIALGPVTTPELVDLIWGTGKYIETIRKFWETGLAVPTDAQEAEVDKLAALVERLRS